MTGNRRRILAVGSMALDTVRTPFGRVKDALGGSAAYFGVASRFFSRVSIVAVVGRDFPKKHLALLKRLGINISGIDVSHGKTFRWHGSYDYDLNTARTLKTELNVFQHFSPKISAVNRRCGVVFLANIDPEIQSAVLNQVDRPWLVACDTMNYWIENKKKALLRLMRKVGVFLSNDSEIRQLSGEYNLIRASRWVLSRGPRLVVIKKGEHGVICAGDGFLFLAPAYLLEKVFDPTGAGDSFAGGFIGYLSREGKISPESVRQAIIYGSILASYNVESFSLKRLASLTREQIRRRVVHFKKVTNF